jgi:hypothetical protein
MSALPERAPFSEPHICYEKGVLINSNQNWQRVLQGENQFFIIKENQHNYAKTFQLYDLNNSINASDGNILKENQTVISRSFENLLTDSFIEIKKWEGRVTAIDRQREEFWAFLKDRKDPSVTEESYFGFDDIDEDDIKLLEEGAIFYWSIGYQRSGSGGRQKVSIIRFRRLPALHLNNQSKINEKFNALRARFSHTDDAKT